jgi:hypothetical protein
MIEHDVFYSASNLNGNPFRSNATFDDDPRLEVWAGYDREQNALQKFLIRSRAEQVGNANFLILYGEYGTGKSHALLWASHWIRHYGGDKKSSAYLIPTLKKDKGRLTFAGALNDDIIAKTTFLDDVLAYKQFLERSLIRYIQEKELGTEAKNIDQIEKVIPPVELHAFAKQIFRCDSVEEIRRVVSPPGVTDYQAMTNFAKVVNLFVYEIRFRDGIDRFRQSVYLLIDELDVLRSASSKEVLEVNDLLRHIYDSCPNSFGLVVAMSVAQEVIPTVLTEYVLGRVNRQIEFPVLDRDSAVAFAVNIMDQMRSSPEDRSKRGPFPFTQDALDALIGQLTFRTPRKVVNTMQQVIEEARIAGLNPRDGPIDVQKLDDAGILEEVIGQVR